MQYTDKEVRQALEECAKENVKSPGYIQPIGVLLACEMSTGIIRYASQNADTVFNKPAESLLGCNAREIVGKEIWHAFLNYSSLKDFAERRFFAGLYSHNKINHAVHISSGGEFLNIEIENSDELPQTSPEMLREQSFIIHEIQACNTTEALFNLSCQLLRHITGFDRVMIYQFDADWNGEIKAEAKKSAIPSFLGLHFPHWDIPEQARAIMARIPLRLISDIDYEDIPIIAENSILPPLDISLVQSRSASRIHTQYLHNMNVKSTMTLSVVVDDQLWGMISFHHEKPRTASPQIRQLLTSAFLPIFNLKLGLLQGKSTVDLSKQLDALQNDMQSELEKNINISELLARVGPTICSTLDVIGLAITAGSQVYSNGVVPDQEAIEFLVNRVQVSNQGMLAIDSLSTYFEDASVDFGELAGVLAISQSNNRCLLVFRQEIRANIQWAGNPDKTIESVDGQLRLQPRGSFSRFMQDNLGKCKSWTDQDRYLIKQLWPLLSAAERQAFMVDISRQQKLMINELNHRVRNILSLVKSVSQTSKRSTGSLESYSQALEARIMALAAAHDIGMGTAHAAVSIQRIFTLELKPFYSRKQFLLTGEDCHLKADVAPIFALVVHELTTNAVKYGALASTEGTVSISINNIESGVEIKWVESNGPTVTEPGKFGFGTTLIQQAIPYEMQGTSNLEFKTTGLEVVMTLPKTVIDSSSSIDQTRDDPGSIAPPVVRIDTKQKTVLILEDNFMIASNMRLTLEDMGFNHIEVCATEDDALAFIQSATPSFALLDVNLGQGKTSFTVASQLVNKGIPLSFVSGYGESMTMPPDLDGINVLTKPVSDKDLADCILNLIGKRELI